MEQRVEARVVARLGQVGELVGHDVVEADGVVGGEPGVDADAARLRRAGAPARLHIAQLPARGSQSAGRLHSRHHVREGTLELGAPELRGAGAGRELDGLAPERDLAFAGRPRGASFLGPRHRPLDPIRVLGEKRGRSFLAYLPGNAHARGAVRANPQVDAPHGFPLDDDVDAVRLQYICLSTGHGAILGLASRRLGCGKQPTERISR